VIDLDAVAQTREGSRFDKAVALLIGLVAVLASVLAVLQVSTSSDENRAHAMAARLTSEVTTNLSASAALSEMRLQSAQRAYLLGLEASSRQIVALTDGDAAGQAVGAAELVASERLVGVADRMAMLPRRDGPVDPYVRSVLASQQADQEALTAEQNRQVDLAIVASARVGLVVVGLSLVALAGVLGGLAALLRGGRAGRGTLLAAYVVLVFSFLAAVASTVWMPALPPTG
jgi:hypothetical protein